MDPASLRLHEILIRAASMAISGWQKWLDDKKRAVKTSTTTTVSTS